MSRTSGTQPEPCPHTKGQLEPCPHTKGLCCQRAKDGSSAKSLTPQTQQVASSKTCKLPATAAPEDPQLQPQGLDLSSCRVLHRGCHLGPRGLCMYKLGVSTHRIHRWTVTQDRLPNAGLPDTKEKLKPSSICLACEVVCLVLLGK